GRLLERGPSCAGDRVPALGAVLDPERDRQAEHRIALLEGLDVRCVLAQGNVAGLLPLLDSAHLLEVPLVQPLPELLGRLVVVGDDAEAGQRLDDRRTQPHHGSSVTPDVRLASRARTKSRSDSRLRYVTTCGSTSSWCARATTRRSARRHTVREKWRSAAAGEPPGRMKAFRGGSVSSLASIASSNRFTCAAVTAAFGLRSATRPCGSASCAPRANRSFWIWARSVSRPASSCCARTTPRHALSSSTSP